MKSLKAFTPHEVFHVITSCPEAERRAYLAGDARLMVLKELAQAYESLSSHLDSVERVVAEARDRVGQGMGFIYGSLLRSSCIDDARYLAAHIEELRRMVEKFTLTQDDPECDEVDRFVHAHLSE